MKLGSREFLGVRMSPEFASRREHRRHATETHRLDEVLRSARSPLLEFLISRLCILMEILSRNCR